MKRLAILLLTIFTMATAVACGCGDSKKNSSFDDTTVADSVQLQTVEEALVDENEQEKPECPDCKKHDGECPTPRKPHRRHDKKTPRPRPAYRKDR